MIAIAITAWPVYARIARAEVLTFCNSEFIMAVQMQGASHLRATRGLTNLLVTHDLPIVSFLSDRMGVLRRGRREEISPASMLASGQLQSAYGNALMASSSG